MARICLSFDNGPDPEVTPRVLEILARHQLQALFFVLGHKLAAPGGLELARKIVAAGHRLGNHSYSHTTPLGRDPRPDAIARELGDTATLLAEVWEGPRWFRPFGGGGVLGPHLLSPEAITYMQAHRYTCVLWNCVPRDWEDPEGWVERALAAAEADSDGHLLVVLHDFLPAPMVHLDAFLSAARARGHDFTETLPPSCLPIFEGEARCDLSPYVSDPRS